MSAHTPGPWAVASSDYAILSDTPSGRFLVGVAHHGPQRVAIDTREIPSDVAQANARLIASAPDLLEALEIARDYIEYAMAEPEDIAFIDSAIAKATGGAE